MEKKIRNLIFGSSFLSFFAFFIRLLNIWRFNLSNFLLSLRWLFSISEFTNYNYDLTKVSKDNLISFISYITGNKHDVTKQYFDEIESDIKFLSYLQLRISLLKRKNELPRKIFFARRLGWYALVRILKPEVVVETGTDKGLGTLVIAQALKRNGSGVIYTLDKDPFAGALIDEEYWENIKILRGDSLQNLTTIKNVDIFIHDSDHSFDHETAEYESIAQNLTSKAIVLSDNSEHNSALLEWSTRNNRNFVSFKETPKNHWYSGDGIGFSKKTDT